MPPIPVFIGAAIVDSINPCAFGVLIFLLAYLTKTAARKRKLLLHGLTYIIAVFITYFSAGLILLPVIGNLGRLSVFFYVVIGLIVIYFGLLELKDFFWYGKGPSLTLFPGAAKRLETYVKHISTNLSTAFFLGVFVALVELPCTGAVYIAILSVMALAGVDISGIAWLVVYNIIFVAPLVLILLAFYRGTSEERLEEWRKKHRGYMRLVTGVVLLLMGGWMLQTALF